MDLTAFSSTVHAMDYITRYELDSPELPRRKLPPFFFYVVLDWCNLGRLNVDDRPELVNDKPEGKVCHFVAWTDD